MTAILSAYANLIPITLLQGVIYAFVALGIMIPFRLLAFPDLTAEGSFPLGASVTAAALAAGFGPLTATALALMAGLMAGATTALIHRVLRLNTLLCGILVVTMLYSIDIRIMGKPNIPMFTYDDLFSIFLGAHARDLAPRIALVSGAAVLCTLALYAFLKTEMGFALRAVGASQSMARAQGLSVSSYVLLGIGMAGALSALGGSILAQSQSFADVNMGFGVLVNGLASLIVGEQLIGRQTLLRQLAAPLVGAIVYYQVVSLALALGMQPSDLKLLTGLFVLLLLALPLLRRNAERSEMPG
jgi:putative tryptophan/tyrosine transport system permease protein